MKRTILILLFLLSFTTVCAAKNITINYETDTVFTNGMSLDEQKLNIEKKTYKRLIKEVEDQYGTAITSYTETRNFVLVEDIIAKSTSVGVKIKKKEHKLIEKGGAAMVHSVFSFVVDTDKIVNYRPDLEKLHRAEEALKREQERNQQLDQDLTQQKKINSMLDYAPAKGRDEDNKGYTYLMNEVVPLLNAGRISDAHAKIQMCKMFFQTDHPEYEYYLGLILLEQKRYKEAEACFDKANNLHSTARYLKSKGDALYYQGNYEGARLTYEQVISIKQNSAAAWANLGACLWYLYRDKDVSKAVKAYDKACAIGGSPRARQIRDSLEGQYVPYHSNKPGTGKATKYSRRVLPLC